MAPISPTLGAPRQSRGARLVNMRAPTWPPSPRRSGRPGKAVAPLDIAVYRAEIVPGTVARRTASGSGRVTGIPRRPSFALSIP